MTSSLQKVAPLVVSLALAAGIPVAIANPVAVLDDRSMLDVEDRSTRVLALVERMSEADLKEFYLYCSREAVRGRLGNAEIALCSTGYERLLKGTFGGNFHALLEWRRGLGHSKARPSPF